MALVRYLPASAVSQQAGQELALAPGATVTIVAEGGTTPLALVDGNGLTIANPLTVTSLGFVPGFFIEDGPDIIEAWSGDFRSPLWSPTGQTNRAIAAEASASASAGSAADSAQAAIDAANLVGAPSDVIVSGLVNTDGTLTRDAVVGATSSMADDAAAGLVATTGTQTNAAVVAVAEGVVDTAIAPLNSQLGTIDAATADATGGTLARRDQDGRLSVATASANTHAVNLGQVNTALAGKVSSTTITAWEALPGSVIDAMAAAGTLHPTTIYDRLEG